MRNGDCSDRASSAGKSTLALALQQLLAMDDRPWVIFAWDDFVPRLPERWTSVPGATGDRAPDGCVLRLNVDTSTRAPEVFAAQIVESLAR